MSNEKYNKETIEFAQELENRLERIENKRLHDDNTPPNRERNEFSRDYARILYSSSFRRLQGKMQLLGINASHFYRNRLTHSLEVAQIAREIAHRLDLSTTVVAESAALAHDLGNPPFGHYGETILDELTKECGGFEGNAQTFRILNYLEKKSPAYRGLNLTARTMLGVVKYFNKRSTQVGEKEYKKFLYSDDYSMLSEFLDINGCYVSKSIDAQIMDLADEIAYGAHDLEDAIGMGWVAYEELLYEVRLDEKYNSCADELEKIINEGRETGRRAFQLKTSEEYSHITKKEVTSQIVNKLVCDIGVINTTAGQELGFSNYALLAEALKKKVFTCILRKDTIRTYELKGESIIKGLFEVYTSTELNKNNLLLPAEYRSDSEQCPIRAARDYISGMMDAFAVQQYEKYFGIGSSERIAKQHFKTD